MSEIYLFTGPEIGEKNDAISTIRAKAKKNNSSLDEYTYYVSDKSVSEVVAQLENISLFSSALFIVYKNCEQIKLKNDIDLLVSYIKQSKEGQNTLILLSDENSIEKKIENAGPSSQKKIFWEMFENQKPQWIRNYFKKNGYTVTDEAIDSILCMVDNNTQNLKNECSRFTFCFPKGTEITVNDVDKILTHNREENAFTLFESLCDVSNNETKRFEESLEILQKIRLSRDSNAVSIIAGLTYCFRQLKLWHDIHSSVAGVTDSVLKANGFSGKKNQERYSKAAKIWGSGETSSIISLLASTDVSIREMGSSVEDTKLITLLYSIVMKKGLYMALYE